jgi:hypothetical protein
VLDCLDRPSRPLDQAVANRRYAKNLTKASADTAEMKIAFTGPLAEAEPWVGLERVGKKIRPV